MQEEERKQLGFHIHAWICRLAVRKILSSLTLCLNVWEWQEKKVALDPNVSFLPSFFLQKDNFLRGDSSRKVQHQQQRKPRKKTKPPALTKKHKKKRRRGPRRPQKPIPPAVPQGNLSMPTSISLPVEISHIRSVPVVPHSIYFNFLIKK